MTTKSESLLVYDAVITNNEIEKAPNYNLKLYWKQRYSSLPSHSDIFSTKKTIHSKMIDWTLFLNITCFVIIGEFSTDLLVMALTLFCRKSQLVADIEREMIETKSKMDRISMVDEFAKYAKLQRKLIALKEQLRVENKENNELFSSMKYITSFAVDLFWNAICSYIIWNNLNTPLLHLNPSWLSPLNTLIGWPSIQNGDVGILSWYMIVKNVTKSLRSRK